MLVEQAIYTSCQTSRASGYQLAAASGGITDEDLRELSLWGPSHDSLWEPGPTAMSVNFHRLPSGAYCVSQTTPAGAEYSGRRGPQVYTQSLVVDAAGLEEFHNDPFALLQAAIALGHACVLEKIPKRLDPFFVDAEPFEYNDEALAQFVRHPGPVWLGVLLETAISVKALGVVGGDRGAALVAALVKCLPRECRREFSFTTGLRYSPRRPYRVICLPSNSPENLRLVRQQQVTLFELKGRPPEAVALGGWASFVTAAIASGNSDYLANELARPRENFSLAGLNRLGDQLSQGLRALQTTPTTATSSKERTASAESPARQLPRAANEPAALDLDPWQRADGAHGRLPVVATQLDADTLVQERDDSLLIDEEPAREMSKSCPQSLTDLQQLEDMIFEFMAGKSDVLNELQTHWVKVLSQVGASRTMATRENYMRYTLAVWRRLNDADEHHAPQRSLSAMQVISLLVAE